MLKTQTIMIAVSLVAFTGCFQGKGKRALQTGEQPPGAADGLGNLPAGSSPDLAKGAGGDVSIEGVAPDAAAAPGASGGALTQDQLADGAKYIGGWRGERDEIPADAGFVIKDIATPSKGGADDKIGNQPDPDPDPDADTKDDADANAGGGDPSVVVFEIPKLAGTAQACARSNGQCKNTPWNSAQTPIIITDQTRTVRIVNNDDVDHQLHANGQVLPHGNMIPPGGSEELRIIGTNFQTLNLYDHGMGESSQARVYFQKQ